MKISFFKQLVMVTVFLLTLALPAWLGGYDALRLLAGIHLGFLALFVVLALLKWGTLTLRWQEVLATGGHSISLVRIFPIVLASDFIAENTPTHIGATACNILFLKREGIPASISTACCGLIFMLDLTAVLLLLSTFALLALQTDGSSLIWLSLGCLGLIILTLSGAAFLFRQAENVSRILIHSPLQYLCPPRYRRSVLNFLFHLKKQLAQAATLSSKKLFLLFLLSLMHWGIRFSMLYLAIIAVGGNVSWPLTAIAQFVGGLAGMMTLLPGGFPGADISVLALLHTFESTSILLPALLLWRLTTYHASFLAGGTAFLWLGNKALSHENHRPK